MFPGGTAANLDGARTSPNRLRFASACGSRPPFWPCTSWFVVRLDLGVAPGSVVGGVRHPLPAAPRGQRGAVSWTRRGQPASGVPRTDAGAACHAPTKTEHRPIQKGEPAPRDPAPNIALFMRRRSARHMVHGGPVGRAPRRAHRKRWKRAMFCCGRRRSRRARTGI